MWKTLRLLRWLIYYCPGRSEPVGFCAVVADDDDDCCCCCGETGDALR